MTLSPLALEADDWKKLHWISGTVRTHPQDNGQRANFFFSGIHGKSYTRYETGLTWKLIQFHMQLQFLYSEWC